MATFISVYRPVHPNLENQKINFVFERRLKAVIEAGGCHVEGKKTRFKSSIVTIIVYSCLDLIYVEKMKYVIFSIF